MIELTDHRGRKELISPNAIARVTEATAASQWHGIRCFIKLFDGSTIECGDDMQHVLGLINAAKEQHHD